MKLLYILSISILVGISFNTIAKTTVATYPALKKAYF